MRWLKGPAFLALIVLVGLSTDWQRVSSQSKEVVAKVDQTYRGAQDVYDKTTGFFGAIAEGWGFISRQTKTVFRLDLSEPLVTGETWSGYTILGCDPKIPRQPCTIRYPQPIVWRAPRDGIVGKLGDKTTYESPHIPGYRLLFGGNEPVPVGAVKEKQILVTAPEGEIQLWLQESNETGWNFVPPSKMTFWGLIQ